jgi:hypothetical protein
MGKVAPQSRAAAIHFVRSASTGWIVVARWADHHAAKSPVNGVLRKLLQASVSLFLSGLTIARNSLYSLIFKRFNKSPLDFRCNFRANGPVLGASLLHPLRRIL